MDDYTEREHALIRALGRTIAAERTAIKMSQETLAKRVAISQKSLGRYERGERDAQFSTLIAVADALGMSVTQLMLAAEARRDSEALARGRGVGE